MSIYVLQTRTGSEESICKKLAERKIFAFSPSEIRLERQGGSWHSRKRLLLPGYVLLEADALTDLLYYQVRETPGVLAFLGRPPAALPPDEEAVWSLCREALYPSDFLLAHGTLRAVSGAWRGRELPVLAVNRRQKRVLVRVSFFGKERELELSLPTV